MTPTIIPDDHEARVAYVCRRFDAREALLGALIEEGVLHQADFGIVLRRYDAPSQDFPLGAPWDRIAEMANEELARFIATAATVREAVWTEYARGEIAWDSMADELDRRQEIANTVQVGEDWHLPLQEAVPHHHQVFRIEDRLLQNLGEAIDFALGVHRPRVLQMAEMPLEEVQSDT